MSLEVSLIAQLSQGSDVLLHLSWAVARVFSYVFFLLQAKVQEYYKQMNDLVSETYSEEDQQIIGCPSIQQVSTSTVLLQLLNECKYLVPVK